MTQIPFSYRKVGRRPSVLTDGGMPFKEYKENGKMGSAKSASY
jgi:hypothetical protein